MTVYFLADDAGIGNTATSHIMEAWRQNLLDGFSIVANRDCFVPIQDILQKNSRRACILSAHLNLTDGKAIASHGRNAVVADDEGRLRISFLKAFYLVLAGGKQKNRFLNEVYKEWDAQLTFIKEVCGERKLNVVNGHNHLHMIPALFRIAAELATKHGIPSIRISREHFMAQSISNYLQPFFYFNFSKLIVLSICRFLIRNKAAFKKGFTQEVFGILFSGNISKERVIRARLNAEKRKVPSMEMIFHPGQSTASEMKEWATYKSGAFFFVHPNRKKELEILKQLRHEQ